jgi:hypothetical protein
MQTAQNAARRARVIILYEIGCKPGELLKLSLIEALEEEASRIAKYLGLDDQDIRYIGTNDIHESEHFFVQQA